MPTLASYPTPAIVREAYAGGFAENGTFIITLDELRAFDPGTGRGAERLHRCPACGATERAFHANSETGRFNCKRASCKVSGLFREFWTDSPKPSGRAKVQARLKKAFELPPMAPQVADLAAAADEDTSNWRAQWDNALPLEEVSAFPAHDYLAGRVLPVSVAIAAGARFSRNWAPSRTGKVYRGAPAILYPLRDMDGALQAVSGRYLRPMAYDRKNEKTGEVTLDTVKARTGGEAHKGAFWCPVVDCWGKWIAPADVSHLVIVEGPADALALAYLGVPSIALSGTNPPEWLHRAAAFKTVWVGLDNDEGGENGAAAVSEKVNGYARDAKRLRLDSGHWGEAAKDFGEVIERRSGMAALQDFLRVFAPGLREECRRARLETNR
jgi:hypothetical protein